MVSYRDLSPGTLFFNIYISDLPNTVSRKYPYADDLVIMHDDGDRQAVEGVLSKGMATIGEYSTSRLGSKSSALQKRCQQPSILTTRKLNVR